MSTYRERLEAEIVDLRDTLDAARRQREEEHRLRRRAEAKVARVEALAEAMGEVRRAELRDTPSDVLPVRVPGEALREAEMWETEGGAA